MGALVSAVHQGKALYVGISSYDPDRTRQTAKILKSMGVPLLIHQPSYSMLNRWIEKGLLDALEEVGAGCIAFSPLAQGLLTSKYLKGVPKDSRAKSEGSSMLKEFLNEKNLKNVRALNEIAESRGQTLAQMAIAWVLRDSRVTSALIGARNVEQLDDSLDALKKLKFTAAELKEIDRYAQEGDVDLWRRGRERMT
jgi:L-glyceraldehyde 3-phosphate reductase